MKTCTNCLNAEWRRTAAGSLHPSGDGVCRKAREWKVPLLPACSYWISGEPKPSGGTINRRQELKEHCPYWAPAA